MTAPTPDTVDWRDRGFPPSVDGCTVAEVVARGLTLDDFLTPIATLDPAAIAGNIAAMAAYCAGHGVRLAPHAKTVMSPRLAADQLAAGAIAVTVATVSQARVFRAHGARRLLLANQLVDPVGIAWVRAELAADPDARLACFVDSPEGAALLAGAAGTGRDLDVYVEFGAEGGRAGCRTPGAAVDTARAVAGLPGLRLAGVAGWEGGLAADRRPASAQRVRSYLRRLGEVAAALAPLHDGDDFHVTVGGSVYFDLVVDELAPAWPVVLRSGCTLLHDSGHYGRLTPLPQLRPALRVWAHVLSVPEPGLAIAGAGRRDMGYDAGLPVPELIRRGGGPGTPAGSLRVTALNDQHAFVHGAGPRIGDAIGFGISHPCTTADRWRLIPVLDGDRRVVDCVRTYF